MAINKDHGHSLLEMAIVLLIFSICLLIPLIMFPDVNKQREMTAFIDQFVEDLHYTQQQAMVTNKTAHFHIQPFNHFYEIKVGDKLVKRVDMPDYVQFDGHSIKPDQIFFNRNGNLSYSGTMEIYAGDSRYRFVFLIGSGRFYYEKTR